MQTHFPFECWMSAMANHGAPLESDDDPDCPNCRGQGTTIALWNYIDPSLVTQPGATNLWTGDNTWSDLMPILDNGSDNDLPELIPPEELTNHGQSYPSQTVEPNPRLALQSSLVEQPVVAVTFPSIIRWKLQQIVAPKVSGELLTLEAQGVFDPPDEIVRPHTEQFHDLDQLVSIAHETYRLVASLCYLAHI